MMPELARAIALTALDVVGGRARRSGRPVTIEDLSEYLLEERGFHGPAHRAIDDALVAELSRLQAEVDARRQAEASVRRALMSPARVRQPRRPRPIQMDMLAGGSS